MRLRNTVLEGKSDRIGSTRHRKGAAELAHRTERGHVHESGNIDQLRIQHAAEFFPRNGQSQNNTFILRQHRIEEALARELVIGVVEFEGETLRRESGFASVYP